MHRSFFAVLALAVSFGIAGCAGQSRAEKVGTVGGAAAGGYLGNKAGEVYDKKHRD